MTAERPIPELLQLSESQLYVELGKQLLDEGSGFGVEDVARAQRYAKQWLDTRTEQLKLEVCANRAVRQIRAKETGDRLEEIAVVIDSMQSLKGHPSASVVAVILVRRGLEALCGPPA